MSSARFGVMAVILAAGVTTGCGRELWDRDATLIIQYPGDHRIMSPGWNMPAQFLMFRPLVWFDDRGETIPDLARAWEHSDDYRTWTVHLRSDVRWHDGAPFTAHDVQFTIELNPHYQFERTGARTVTVLDDTTFVLSLARPSSELSSWDVYYPRHLLEGLNPDSVESWSFWAMPVGNGPYRYVRHVPQTMIELGAYAGFHGGSPHIERIVLKFGSGLPSELLSGAVDVLTSIEWSDLPVLRQDPRFAVYERLWPDVAWVEAIYWNTRDAALADPRVRRALTLAIDRPELRRLLEISDEIPIVDVPFSPRQFRSGDVPAARSRDVDAAEALLDSAGWRRPRSGSVRTKDGVALRIRFQVNATYSEAVVYLQAQLKEVGVEVVVDLVTNPGERAAAGDFQATIMRLFNGEADRPWWGADGLTGYARAEALQLFDELASQTGPVRDSTLEKLWPFILEDVPVTLLFPRVGAVVAHKRVQGLSSPYRASPIIDAVSVRLLPMDR